MYYTVTYIHTLGAVVHDDDDWLSLDVTPELRVHAFQRWGGSDGQNTLKGFGSRTGWDGLDSSVLFAYSLLYIDSTTYRTDRRMGRLASQKHFRKWMERKRKGKERKKRKKEIQ